MSICAVARMQGQQGRRSLGHKRLCRCRTESDLLHKFPCRLTTVFMSTWLLFFVFQRLETRWNIHVFLNTATQDSLTELDFIWRQRVLGPVQQLKRVMSGRCVSWSEVPRVVRHRHAKGGGCFQRHQLANHTGQVTPGIKGETTDDNMSWCNLRASVPQLCIHVTSRLFETTSAAVMGAEAAQVIQLITQSLLLKGRRTHQHRHLKSQTVPCCMSSMSESYSYLLGWPRSWVYSHF